MAIKNINVGCSSFSNGYWKGIFYPEDLPRKEWFAYYGQHFKTYEINATFYRFPTLKSLQGWYDKTPEDFLFAVKAPKLITHLKKFIGVESEMDAFYDICQQGLGKKLGTILFQLPPSFDFSEEKLAMIVNRLKPELDNVVEFRNQSWWHPKVFEAFSQNKITFCSVSYPKLPKQIIVNNGNVYIRMHGDPKLFYSSYDEATLTGIAEELIVNSNIETASVFFNNTASTAGILNAISFKKLLKS